MMNAHAFSPPFCMRAAAALFGALHWMMPPLAWSKEFDWSIGEYAGKYYDSEPAGFLNGRGNFLDHHLFALTASKTVWRSATLPLSLELDAMIGHQTGLATLSEVAIAPALRWGGFPWGNTVQTDLRLAPLGISYTSKISPLELGAAGRGSRTLNYLFIELAFSRPASKENEFFMRLHHRCAIYDLLNNYGANGEDFFAVGYRYRF